MSSFPMYDHSTFATDKRTIQQPIEDAKIVYKGVNRLIYIPCNESHEFPQPGTHIRSRSI